VKDLKVGEGCETQRQQKFTNFSNSSFAAVRLEIVRDRHIVFADSTFSLLSGVLITTYKVAHHSDASLIPDVSLTC
jgi:hypothetical protein